MAIANQCALSPEAVMSLVGCADGRNQTWVQKLLGLYMFV